MKLHRRDAARRALVAGALVPFAVSAVSSLARGGRYRSVLDHAVIELRTHDVVAHLPLVGPYSRFGWNHPGPLLYYLLAAPHRLLGSSSSGLLLGALLINAAAVATAVVAALRAGGRRCAVVTLLVTGILCCALGGNFLRDPWNPHVTVLPCFAFFVLVWATTVGVRAAWPVAVVIGAFLVQSHLGYAVPVLVLLVWATPWYLRRLGREAVRPMVVGLALALVLFVPPIVEQLRSDPGNLTLLWRFASDGGAGHSLARSLDVVGVQVGTRPEWLLGALPPAPFTGDAPEGGGFPVVLVLLAVAGAFGWRRKDAPLLLLLGTTVVALGSGVAAVMNIQDEVLVYLVRWTWAAGALAGVCLAWAAAEALAGVRTTGSAAARIDLGLTVAAAAAVLAATVGGATAPPFMEAQSRVERRLAGPVLEAIPRRATVALHASGHFDAQLFRAALAVELERRGTRILVEPKDEHVFGGHRIGRGHRVDATFVVVAGAESREAESLDAAGRNGSVVVRVRDVPKAAEAKRVRQLAALTAAFRRGQLDAPSYAKVSAQLQELPYDVAVLRR